MKASRSSAGCERSTTLQHPAFQRSLSCKPCRSCNGCSLSSSRNRHVLPHHSKDVAKDLLSTRHYHALSTSRASSRGCASPCENVTARCKTLPTQCRHCLHRKNGLSARIRQTSAAGAVTGKALHQPGPKRIGPCRSGVQCLGFEWLCMGKAAQLPLHFGAPAFLELASHV